ncbi:LysR family transcriptional regulator [Zoogloea sp.]|uniref:LysR family transcriptional regulator n=1 Tax=Zoogloea sp. TaxID=49181 RepID=UPI001ACFA5DF|nr:LysR family transcriptional regulator [Zoogloea sp.]MBN8285170.1 LysR family transcriptional regulator [Zoogloea sp.]
MELRQLKYFEAVASTLNFSRAAERLHIAQPPLSRQIQQLEEELGVALLDRSSRPLKLTNAGSFFYDQTVQILARLKEVQIATRRIGDGSTRWMGIGFVPSILYGFLPNVLQRFTTENDNLDISLSELTSVQQAEALKAGRIDVGFGRLAIQDEGLQNIVLTEESLVVAIPSGSALTQEGEISLRRLVDEVLVLYPASPRPSFADQVLHQFSVRGYEVGKIYETNGLQTAIGLVAAGMGVTIVPDSVQRLRRDDVTYRPLTEKGLTSPLIMTLRVGDSSSHVQKFRAMIDAALRDGRV